MGVRLVAVGLFLGLLLFPFHTTSAQVRTVEVTGVVDDIAIQGNMTLDGSVQVGTVMTGTCTYEATTPDLDSSDYSGIYSLLSQTMAIGNYTFYDDQPYSAAFFNTWVTDAYFQSISNQTIFDGTVQDEGVTKTYDDFDWYKDEATLFHLGNNTTSNPDDSLPDSFPPLTFFTGQNQFKVDFLSNLSYPGDVDYDGFTITGHITSIEIVPEPTMLCALTLGGLGLIRKRVNRR
jgi:hypothetical protein